MGGGTVGLLSSATAPAPFPAIARAAFSTARRMNSRSSSFPAAGGCPSRKSTRLVCEVAVGSDLSPSTSEAVIGARVKVTVPLKVYHVPKVAEVDITGMEGEVKQYVALWKGKRISANLPYKVQFFVDVQGRGPVKFFAHLKEDEFEYL
ncbi:ferredoxin-thioredoxin reductase, variable chain [Argentina anserina]|uniref:ferredoxin-thioredoxin reductase, variable chain n=1 Tax=Argentina anserina TaxID=57926 RepID=UPI0021763676|nr:ferredoxin-thioredoxin reductase, variable chain [Potentilla anserina]